MKNFHKYFRSFAAILLVAPLMIGLSSCKKGEEDPLLSLQSRTARMSQFWTLEEFKVNGVDQNRDATVTWDIEKNGTLTEEIEGTIAGVQTSETNNATWMFRNDKEDLYVNFSDDGDEQFIIDRLSGRDLWLRQVEDGDVYEWVFYQR